ncbi:hypothetical protein AAFC00_005005 [Neodothiora populina]|uniref:Major facilitator superfamily (MFS) profile domain-containing protein n=1 Tax=Neodothiora populina TaxID=2781224 RepID=A0ABR3P490_9PEZI
MAAPTSNPALSEKDVNISAEKDGALFCEDVASINTANRVPELLRDLAPEERQRLEKKLVRRIDLRLLPMLVIMYILNYLDRNNIASAKLAGKVGMVEDLNMTSTQFNTCVSILFVGYILMQVPSNLLLSYMGKPAIYLPTVMIVWGIISGSIAAAQSYGAVVAIRFCLGFVEAAYFPGCLFFLSCWYTRKELALRTAMLYAGSLISGAFSGLIAAGISDGMDGVKGLGAWRWLFIIEGAVTVAVAFAAYFILPDFPHTTTWLSEQERQLAVYRLQEDVGVAETEDESGSFFHGFVLCLKDPKTYILLFVLLGITSSASVTNFFPTVVATLGYSHVHTLLLTAPPYVLAFITASFNAWHADKTGERFYHIVLPLIVSVAAFILAAATTATAPRYVAMMLMPASFYMSFVVTLAWISNTLMRPKSKRAASLALINCLSNTTSIYASYMYKDTMGPRYIIAFSVNCSTAVIAIVAALVLKITLTRLNKKLDRGEYVEGVPMGGPAAGNGGGEQKGFRFLV